MSGGSPGGEQQPQRRLLTEGEGCKNGGHDTQDNDLVMREGDVLYNSGTNVSYRVEALLGCGTFGQVVKCTCDGYQQEVAVKVIKNQSAYFSQAVIEVHILKMLNKHHDPDEAHLVRMLDYFTYKNHLCIVFERLQANLFEVLRHNSYHGLSMNLVRLITKQVLEAMCVLRKARVIHCDLKPENILLVSESGIDVKVIDFGSACFENKTVYSYIQSRFYRSPEVLMGHSYNGMVDVWSLGCVAAELFLGLPLFPGASDYDMVKRIEEFIGLPPDQFLSECKYVDKLFTRVDDPQTGWPHYRLKTEDEYAQQHRSKPVIGKQYFKHLGNLDASKPIRLDDVILHYPLDSKLSYEQQEVEKMKRYSFVDFLEGILMSDPAKRWAPWQALQHPFITGAPFTGPFAPPPEPQEATQPSPVDIPRAHAHRARNHPHPAYYADATPPVAASVPIALSSPYASTQGVPAGLGWSLPGSDGNAASFAAAAAMVAALGGSSVDGAASSTAFAQAMASQMMPPCSLGASVSGSLPYSQALQSAMAVAFKSVSHPRYSVDGSYSRSVDGQQSFPTPGLATSASSSSYQPPPDPRLLQFCGMNPNAVNSAAFAAAASAAAAYYGSLQGSAPISASLGNVMQASSQGPILASPVVGSYPAVGSFAEYSMQPVLGVSVGVSVTGEIGPNGHHWPQNTPPAAMHAAPGSNANSGKAQPVPPKSRKKGSRPPAHPQSKQLRMSSDVLGSSPVGLNEWDPFFGETSEPDCLYVTNRNSDEMASELADEDTRSQLSPANAPEEPLEVLSARANESQGHSHAHNWPSPGGVACRHARTDHETSEAAREGGASVPTAQGSGAAYSDKAWVSDPSRMPGNAPAMAVSPSGRFYVDQGRKHPLGGSHVIVVDQHDISGTSGPESDVFGLSFDQCSNHENSDPHHQVPLVGGSDSAAPMVWRDSDAQAPPPQPVAHHLEPEHESAASYTTQYPVAVMPGIIGKGAAQKDAAGVRLGIAGAGVGPYFQQLP